MKITVKTLQQQVFQVRRSARCFLFLLSLRDSQRLSITCVQLDAEGSDTVAVLKEKIYKTRGHAVDAQKLIFSGERSLLCASCLPTREGGFVFVSCRSLIRLVHVVVQAKS